MTSRPADRRRPGLSGLLGQGSQCLARAGDESAAATARILLCHALDVEPARLILCPDPGPDQEQRYRDLIDACAAGRPAQYLTGRAWFRSVRLAVGPGVLIPRPETELVVGEAVQACRDLVARGIRPVVVDLCTGSGAMAAALVREVPTARVHAVELEPEALRWARRNLSGTDVQLHPGDARTVPAGMDGRVDVVMTNPPYLPEALADQVQDEVLANEPGSALFSGADGLDLVRDLVPRAARLLRAGGILVMEHDPSQQHSLPALLTADGHWDRIRDHADLTGRSRFVTAVRRDEGEVVEG